MPGAKEGLPMKQGLVKYGFWAGAVFVLLLALAGAIWGAQFILQQMGLSLQSWADDVFVYLVLAMIIAFFTFPRAAEQAGPAVRLLVGRPEKSAAKDDVTARWRVVNLPYAINDGMVLTLNEGDIPDPAIYADIVVVDRLICPENEEWMIATLELHEPNDFERLGKSAEWYAIRDNAVESPDKPPRPVLVGQPPKTLQ
jgi:hypothetical protein